jgi:signal transduction histidine kinase
MAGQGSIAPRPRRAGSVRDELQHALDGSTGVDEFVHALLAVLVDLNHAHPEHPLLASLARQLDEGANARMVAAAVHDLRSLLQGVSAGLDCAPGLLARSGALIAARERPQEVDGHRLQLLLEAIDDARAGLRLAAELAGESLRVQRDCLAAPTTAPTAASTGEFSGPVNSLESESESESEPEPEPESAGPTRLAEVVAAAVRFAGRRVEVHVENEIPAELEVAASRSELLRVLINLLRNAAHALDELEDPAGAGIRISTWASDELAFVQVADDGPGIPAATLDAIFELFFTTHGDGTGVGLFVCKALVSGWGGMIHVDSRAGEGARFTFSVPLATRRWQPRVDRREPE